MIYFMRHGEDLPEYVGGWSKAPLTEDGKKEVEDVAIWIKNNLNIKKIITSDVERAKETAELVNKYLNVNIEVTTILREQNKGDLTGKLRTTLTKEEKDLLDYQEIDTMFPNGETLIDLYERIKKDFKYFEDLPDDTLLITHRAVINMIYYILKNKELDMNKKQFGVTFSSVHEFDKEKREIRKIR